MSRTAIPSVRRVPARERHPLLIAVVLGEVALLSFGFLASTPLPGAAVALAICYFLIAFRNPDLAWALVWIAVPFDVEALVAGDLAVTLPTEPMIVIALLAWLARSLLAGTWRLRPSPLHLPLMAVSAIVLVSAIWSVRPVATLKSWTMMGGYAAFGYLYMFQAACGPRRRERWLVLTALIGAGWGLFGAARVLSLGGEGLEAAAVASTYAYGAFRPFFSEHGTYSAYLSMLLPAAVLAAMETTGARRLFFGLATLCIAAGVVLSFARAGWLSLAIVLPAMIVIWARRRRAARRVVVPAILALLVALFVGAFGVGQQIGKHATSVVSARNLSNLERLNRWNTALSMVRERPWTGVGYGCYLDAYREFRTKSNVTDQTFIRMGVHSEPLKLLCELGIIGFLVVVWFLGVVCALALRCFGRLPDAGDRVLALAAIAGVSTYFVNGLFNAYLVEAKVTVPFWVGIGVIASLGTRLSSANGRRPSEAPAVPPSRA